MQWQLALEESIRVGDHPIVEMFTVSIEFAAVLAIASGVVVGFIGAVRALFRSDWSTAIATFRRCMGRGLIVGLDLLIAADVIKTVTVEPTMENAAVLGILVLIRTFLNWTTVLEVEGRWPWQPKPPGLTQDQEL